MAGKKTVTAEPQKAPSRLEQIENPLREKFRVPIQRVTTATGWVKALRPYRAYMNFSWNGGWLLAAGMTYKALFALFAAIYVGLSIAAVWLAGRPDLLNAIYELINSLIPNLIGTNETALIHPDEITTGAFFGWLGFAALIGLLWTAIGWLYYSRLAVRSMFGLDRDKSNYALQKVRDLGLGLAFGFVLIFTAAISVVSATFVAEAMGWFGIPPDSLWATLTARISGFTLVLIINTFTLGTMFRVLSKVYIPWKRLAGGSILGAIALGILQALGGLLFTSTKNPLLQSFVVIIGLLLWLNVSSAIILLAASWIAIGMADHEIPAERLTEQQLESRHQAELRNARKVLAQDHIDELQRAFANAGFIRRWGLKRRIRKARAQFKADFAVSAE